MDARVTRAQQVIAGVALLVGIYVLLRGLGMPFAGPEGVSLLPRAGPVGPFSPLAGVVTIVLALAALAGALASARALVVLAGAGFLAAAALVLVQWFGKNDPNWLGGSGSTMAFFGAAGIGLLVLALAPADDSPTYASSRGS